jgi:antitoxin ParD1/3/4
MDKDCHAWQTAPMNVNLTPALEKLIEDKVRSGLYNNRSEVVREALRLLAEQDRLRDAHLEKLRVALDEGIRQADRGELLDGESVVREIRASLRKHRPSRGSK